MLFCCIINQHIHPHTVQLKTYARSAAAWFCFCQQKINKSWHIHVGDKQKCTHVHKWNRNQCFYCMADIVHQLFKHWVLLVSIHNITFKYPLGNCWQPYGNASDTAGYLGNPEYSDCLILCKCFLQRTQSSNKRWRPQTICLRVSIVFIRTNPAKIRIHCMATTCTVGNPGIWRYLGCQQWIPNTAKYLYAH